MRDHEGQGIGQCGQDACPVVVAGLAGVGRALGPRRGDASETPGEDVGQYVASIGEQGQGGSAR